MGIFGWSLPLGCSVSDIPGNRPEDAKWEAIEMNFYENTKDKWGHARFTPEQWKYLGSKNRTKHLEDIIMIAIEYGIEIEHQENIEVQKENKAYYQMYLEETRNPKLRAFFKALRNKAGGKHG